MTYEVIIDGKSHRLELERAEGLWQCRLDGGEIRLDAVLARRDVLSVLLMARRTRLSANARPPTCTCGSEVSVLPRNYAIRARCAAERALRPTSMARKSWSLPCRGKLCACWLRLRPRLKPARAS